MVTEILKIVNFILENIAHVWPYLLISIPMAVTVRMSGASKYIEKAFNRKPLISILLATILGAFSPFCSCSVIPVIATLLIGGVPLAPVMSFWLASPSMDPEIFFLSVSVLNWKLAIWRLSSAFFMSLLSGLITHYLVKRNWIKEDAVLKTRKYSEEQSNWRSIQGIMKQIKDKLYSPVLQPELTTSNLGAISCCKEIPVFSKENKVIACSCGSESKTETKTNAIDGRGKSKIKLYSKSFGNKLTREALNASAMVIRFMVLAYFLEALIVLYIPAQFIRLIVGGNQFFSITLAAMIGVPVYTSSLPALALVGGLIKQGMSPAAGLAFLISGPTTTIPAMAAVWKLASRRVFFLYVGFTLASAIISGFLYYIFSL